MAVTPDQIRQLVERGGGALITRPEILSEALGADPAEVALLLHTVDLVCTESGSGELMIRLNVTQAGTEDEPGGQESSGDRYSEPDGVVSDSEPSPEAGYASVADVPLDRLNLTVRAYNALMRVGINSVGTLLDRTDDELLAVPSLGRRALADIHEAVSRYRPSSIPADAISSSESRPSSPHDWADRWIGDLPLGMPTLKALMRTRLRTVGDLSGLRPEELDRLPGLGKTGRREIRAALRTIGIGPASPPLDDRDRSDPRRAQDRRAFGRLDAAEAAASMERLSADQTSGQLRARARKYAEAFSVAASADEPVSLLDCIAVEAVQLTGARGMIVTDLRTDHTLGELGDILGLSRERIRQIEELALKALRERFVGEPALDALAESLQHGVADNEGLLTALRGGDRWRFTNLCVVLMRACGLENPHGFQSRIKGYWTAAPDCVVRTLSVAAADLPLAEGQLVERSAGLQLPPGFPLEEVTARSGSPLRLHPVLNAWVRPNASHRDAAWLLLKKHGEPVATDALAEMLRMKTHALAESLRRDDRFEQRRPSGWWVLAEWESGYAYSNTLDAARAVIRDMGAVPYETLEREVIGRYPVSKAAVRQTLISVEIGQWPDSLIDLRINGALAIPEPIPALPPAISVDADSESIALKLDVNRDILRGSGVPIPTYVTWWLNLREAPTTQTFASRLGPIVVRRNLGGAALSSLRDAADGLGATIGCQLVVTLRRVDSTATIDLGCVDHTH